MPAAWAGGALTAGPIPPSQHLLPRISAYASDHFSVDPMMPSTFAAGSASARSAMRTFIAASRCTLSRAAAAAGVSAPSTRTPLLERKCERAHHATYPANRCG